MIIGHGNSSADIFFIGDSASSEDEKTGYALSGSAEKTLASFLSQNGVSLKETYRTLYIKEKLEYNGKIKKRVTESFESAIAKISSQCGSSPEELLIDELVSIKPNVVVPLDEFSFQICSGIKSISKYRGSILPARGDIQSKIENKAIKVIPTLGPRILNMNYTARSYVSIDFEKICKFRNYNGFVNPDGKLWIARNAGEFGNYLARQKWENNYVVFDIETQFGIPVCIAFCFDTDEAVCVPLLDRDIGSNDLVCLWQAVSRVLASKIPKVNQNIKYDATIMERFGFSVRNIQGDTVLRSGLIYPELPKNLGFLTSIYTEMPYHKDEGKDPNPKDRTKFYLYCAKDTLATRRIYEQQELELTEEKSLQFLYRERIMPLFFIYKEMDEAGILIDPTARDKLAAKYEVMLQIHQATLNNLTGQEINARSWQQVGKIVYEELKFPSRTKDGNYVTDEDTLEELLLLHECKFQEGKEILRLIITIRKVSKILEYIYTTIHPDNRLRGNFNLSGTENGRTNCTSSIDRMFIIDEKGKVKLDECGRSLQTISKHGFRVGSILFGDDLRSMFIPTPGYIFVEADLSQAEARVDAVLSKDYALLEQFDKPPGVHKLTAGWIYGKDPLSIDKGSLEYHAGKTARHAAERRIGPNHLAISLHITLLEAERILKKFHEAAPNVQNVFHKEIEDFVRANRYLQTPHGRKRTFFDKMEYALFNEAISYIPQATVSDQNKFSFIPIKQEMPFVRYLNETHDSSLVEIKKDELERYAGIVNKHLVVDIDFRNCSLARDYCLRIPCEIEWSETNWHEMVPYKKA